MKFNLALFQQFLKQVYGLDISMYDESFIVNSIEKRIQGTHCDSIEDYWIYLEQNHGESNNLYESLHVHFSEFFRDPLTFALLERLIIPALIQKKIDNLQKEIRIWSAGCAAGQEAYSIAMLLEEMITSTHPSLNYRIFATDVDENILSIARLGRYPAEAIKNISSKRAQTWFSRHGDVFIVQPSIRQHIDFSNFDLLDEERCCPSASIFGEFDLVFCCNLLIYYQPPYRKMILDKIAHCLVRDAYLVTGETERAIAIAHHYSEVYPSAAILRANRKKKGGLHEIIRYEN
ncbi:MAG: CheR family methyltransferase [Coriobacteriia bacterium]